jgi:hypothetical protein
MKDNMGESEWQELPDLTLLGEEELNELLDRLVERERQVSYERRVLHGRIDLIRAELVRRGGRVLSAGELADVLLEGDYAGKDSGGGSVDE